LPPPDIDIAQVVPAGTANPNFLVTLSRAPDGRHRDLAFAGEVLPGQAVGGAHDLIGRPFGDDAATMHAGTGAHVDDVVSCADRFLVVLDHNHGIAEIA
jgi:hypothetical protein